MLRLFAVVALGTTVGGCGQQPAGPQPTASAAQRVVVTMTDYRFAPNPIVVAAGRVTFVATNAGTVGHDFTVLTPDGSRRVAHTQVVPPGDMNVLAVDLAPGRYPVICTQPGHQELGMEATVIAIQSQNGG